MALGTIGPVIKDLETRKLIATFGTTLPKRRLLDAKGLLQEWSPSTPQPSDLNSNLGNSMPKIASGRSKLI